MTPPAASEKAPQEHRVPRGTQTIHYCEMMRFGTEFEYAIA